MGIGRHLAFEIDGFSALLGEDGLDEEKQEWE
jgi:hypothetical protein